MRKGQTASSILPRKAFSPAPSHQPDFRGPLEPHLATPRRHPFRNAQHVLEHPGHPWEIALVGQLLLNQGSYGQLEFFSPETCRQLLPRPVELASGPGSWNEYGIGTSWFRNDGLGPNTYGHGAASSATLRIDPDNGWVIVMTRNRAGRNFRQYHTEFLHLVAESAQP